MDDLDAWLEGLVGYEQPRARVEDLLAERQLVETTDGTLLGTPAYISPEQLRAAGFDVEWLKKADAIAGDQGWADASSVDSAELETDDPRPI